MCRAIKSHHLSDNLSNCDDHTWIKAISTTIIILSSDYTALGSVYFNKGRQVSLASKEMESYQPLGYDEGDG